MTRKMAVIGFSYLLGLFVASFLSFKLNIVIGIILAIFSILTGVLFRKLDKTTYFAFFATIGFALLIYGFYGINIYDKVILLNNQTIYTEAKIENITIESDSRVEYTCKTTNLDQNFTFTLYAYDLKANYDDIICADIGYTKYYNNQYFSSADYHKSKNIFLYGKIVDLSRIKTNRTINYYIKTYSDFVADRISTILPNDAGAVINAMFTGNKTYYSQEIKNQMYQTGIGHIVAISGFHFSVLCGLLMMLLRKTKRYISIPVLLLFSICYCIFSGCSTSSLRACVMVIVFYLSQLVGRKADILNSLGLAAFLLTIFSPFSIKDASLMLSLAGTFGVAVAGKYINEKIDEKFETIFSNFRRTLIASLTAAICTAPISIFVFNTISIAGPFLIVLVTPLCTIALYLTFIFAIFGCLDILIPIINFAEVIISLMLKIIDLLSSFDFIYLYLNDRYIYIWLMVSVIALGLVFFIKRKLKPVAVASIVCIALLILTTIIINAFDKTKFNIALLSDAYTGAIIVYDNDEADIIVTGTDQYTGKNINNHLLENGIDTISSIMFVDLLPSDFPMYKTLYDNFDIDKVIISETDKDIIKTSNIFSQSEIIYLEVVEKIEKECYNIKANKENIVITANNFSMLISKNFDNLADYDIIVTSRKEIDANIKDKRIYNLTSGNYPDNIINVYRNDAFILSVDNLGNIKERSYGYAFYG